MLGRRFPNAWRDQPNDHKYLFNINSSSPAYEFLTDMISIQQDQKALDSLSWPGMLYLRTEGTAEPRVLSYRF